MQAYAAFAAGLVQAVRSLQAPAWVHPLQLSTAAVLEMLALPIIDRAEYRHADAVFAFGS